MSTMRRRSAGRNGRHPSPSDLARARSAPLWATGVPKDVVLRYDLPFLGKEHYGNFNLSLHGGSTLLAMEECVSDEDRTTWTLALFVLSCLVEPLEQRTFLLVGTGDRVHLPELWNHVATKQSRSGYLWHLFEVWPEDGGTNHR